MIMVSWRLGVETEHLHIPTYL